MALHAYQIPSAGRKSWCGRTWTVPLSRILTLCRPRTCALPCGYGPFHSASAFSIGELLQPACVKVADALGDSKTRDVARALGGRLLRTRWSDPDEADAMMYSIHSLNSNVQHEVFSAIAGDVQPLMAKADDWPISLQQAGVDALLASQSTLHLVGWTIEDIARVSRILLLLSRSRLSQGLSDLIVTSTLATRAAACHFADTIAHHTTLSSLTLDDLDLELPTNIHPISHATLATALAPLPLSALTHLSISIRFQLDPHSPDTPPLVAALARAVSGLRRLAILSLHFGNKPHPSSHSPSSRAAPNVCTRATLDPLLSAISAAQALTSLSLTADAHPLPSRAIARPFQHLQSLTLSPSTVPLAAPPRIAPDAVSAQSHPEALPALTTIALTYSSATPPSPALLEAFLAAAAPYRALQRLSVPRIVISPQTPIDPQRALAPLSHLSTLTTLTITLAFASTKPRALPRIAAALGHIPRLEELMLTLCFEGQPRRAPPADSGPTDDTPNVPPYPASLDTAFDGLLALVHLRSLKLSIHADHARDVHAKLLKRLGAALATLVAKRPVAWGNHMTCLQLRTPVPRPLRTFARTMAPMHALRDVDLGAVTVRAGDLAALAPRMPGLTRLVLTAAPVDHMFARRYVAFVAAMPALVRTEVEESLCEDTLAMIEEMPGRARLRRLSSYLTALQELPRRGQYYLPSRWYLAEYLHVRHELAAEELIAAARSTLEERGATVDDDVTFISFEAE